MPLKLADSNYLRSSEIVDYLSATSSNKVALSHPVIIEMFKRNPAVTAKRSLELIRPFSRQVVVLREQADLMGRSIKSAADARKLIDANQTRDLAAFYDTVLNDGGAVGGADLAELQQQAEANIQDIADFIPYLNPAFTFLNKRFSAAELTELRKRISYGETTQRKLLAVMFDLSRSMFTQSGLPKSRFPQLNIHAYNFFLFRYAMCLTLFYTRWVNHGGNLPKLEKTINHVMDIQLAALGTFFGGILSNDQAMMDVQREARYLLRAANVRGSCFVG